MERPGTLGEVLEARLAREPDAEACRFVGPDGAEDAVSVRRLIDKARAYADVYGPAQSGAPAIAGICLYHGLDLYAAFLGAVWAGHVPTMIAPPSPRMESAKYARAFRHVLEHVRPDLLVVDTPTRDKLDGADLASAFAGRIVRAEGVPDRGTAERRRVEPGDVALLQHSSGTTGLQKGIALSHRAILTHNDAYVERIGLDASNVVVSWLPLYHDMGLIACFLLPLLSGVRLVAMSPFDWVLRPALLLEKIHAHRGTRCWLPNFAFSFLAQSVRDESLPPGLDLGCMRAYVNCSERVYDRAHQQFLERFSRFGARPDQMTASYAAAENVFAITQGLPSRYRVLEVDRRAFTDEHRAVPSDAADALPFVSNGTPLPTTEVAVCDDAGALVPPGTVGELLIRGSHLFSGYFRRDDLTARAMTADGWYRSGDLGFVDQGEVFITGRKKDLIIIMGRNYYPDDIEAVAGQVEGVMAGRAVAFGLADEEASTEKLVILVEPAAETTGLEAKRLALKIRNAVSVELDCTPGDVRVVPARWLVKSTSGKLARSDNRDKYLRTFVSRGGS